MRALGVSTRDSGDVSVPAVAALNPIPGGSLSTTDTVIPELDISYYFTRNIAAELVLGVTKHTVSGSGTLAGLDVGKSSLLPPVLTL